MVDSLGAHSGHLFDLEGHPVGDRVRRAPARREILLTLLQSFLGWLLLVNLDLRAFEAGILFVFWLVQFALPSTRGPMIFVYAGWCGVEIADDRDRESESRAPFGPPGAS